MKHFMRDTLHARIFLTFLLLCLFPVKGFAQCPAFTSDQQLSFSAMFMTSADIDGDGYLDFVSTTDNVSDTSRAGIHISFGDSAGFGTPTRLANIRVAPLVVTYIDTDTLLDIVAGCGYTVGGIFLNNGNRTFTRIPFPDSSISVASQAIAAGYFNNDSYTDIIMGPWETGFGKLYLGNGSGGFTLGPALNHGARSVMVADFNEDGKDDFVSQVKPDTSRIYLSLGNGTFSQSTSFVCPGETPGVTLARGTSDFNNDGHADFAFVGFRNPQRSVVTIALGDGSGGVSSVDTFSVIGYHWMIDAGDLNGDNNIDVFSAGASSVGPGPHIAAFLSDGSGGFDTCTITHPGQVATAAMSSGDVDRDGDLDIIVGTEFFGLGPLTILYNDFSSLLSSGSSLSLTGFGGWMDSQRDAQSNSTSIEVEIVNPVGKRFSRTLPGIAGASYWRLDADHNGSVDERIIDNSILNGEYSVIARKTAASSDRFSIVVNVPGTPEAILALNYDGFSGGSPDDSMALHYTNGFNSPVQPRNGIATGTAQPTFKWPTVSGAIAYQIQIDPYHDFRAPLYDNNTLTQPTFIPASTLNNESVYYWRYRSFDGMQWSEYSPTNAAYISACCIGTRGNANGSTDETPTIADLVYMVSFMFNNGPLPNCEMEADVNGSGSITIADLTRLVSYLFASGPAPTACPAN